MSQTEKANLGRVTMNVDVTATSRAGLKPYCQRKKKVQRDVLGQLIDWFGRQPAAVQTVVMDEVDEDVAAAYVATLKRLADDLERSTTATGARLRESSRTGAPKQTMRDRPPMLRAKPGGAGHAGDE